MLPRKNSSCPRFAGSVFAPGLRSSAFLGLLGGRALSRNFIRGNKVTGCARSCRDGVAKRRRPVKRRNFDARRLSPREHASQTWSSESRFLSPSKKKTKENRKAGGVTGSNVSFADVRSDQGSRDKIYVPRRQRFPVSAMNSRRKKFAWRHSSTGSDKINYEVFRAFIELRLARVREK